MEKANILIGILVLLLLSSCDNKENVVSNNNVLSRIVTSPVEELISNFSQGTIGSCDAYQVFMKSTQVYNIHSPESFPNDDYAISIFNVNGKSDYIEYSSINNVNLIPNQPNQFPARYTKDFENVASVDYGGDTYWKFKYPNSQDVRDTLKVPETFGTFLVTNNGFKLNSGCQINWENPNSEEDIVVYIQWIKTNEQLAKNKGGAKYLKTFRNNATFTLTPNDLVNKGIPFDTTTVLAIVLYKGVAKTKTFYGSKKLCTFCGATSTVAFPVIGD